ncbi:aspartyl/asparaginyl beta-hydroxylase isoform X2 [Phlebotomus papatasi]|uniref:aspartyl/asparaginyl beta-hydroxylase isoform X2 n=1 Tax=Phlebotomus papatasi TaxID=29031 RepID=UPI0024842E47|nr:aspartyl/asparaginyl beta-hydroxylase isoform X2 [Phlebotomus papatasi]
MSEKPRKRKDKKKKDSVSDAADIARRLSTKDAGDSVTSHPSGVQSMGPDDVQLHVHKDHGTGGHWCAKIVFFSLMAILAGLVGLIILENRGLSDVDTPLSESRFSEILEGWVDENRESHDDHDHEILASLEELDEHDEHGEPFEEEEDHDQEDEDHDEEDDDHEGDEEEEDHADEEDDEDQANEDEEDQADEEDDEDQANEDDDQEDEDQNVDDNASEELQNDDEEDYQNDQEDDDNADEEENQTNEDNDENEDNDDNDDNNDNEDDNDDNYNQRDIDDDDDAPFEEHLTTNKSIPVPLTQTSDITEKTDTVTVADLEVQIEAMKIAYDEVAQQLGKPSFSELKDATQECPVEDFSFDERIKLDDDGSFEEVIDNDAGEDLHLQKMAQKDEPEPDADDDDQLASPSSSLAEKILIGLALVVVAHSVLLRKTFNKGKAVEEAEVVKGSVDQTSEELIMDEGIIDMRRRLTIGTEDEPLPEPEDDVIYGEDGEEYEYSGEEIEDEDEEIVDDLEEYEDEIDDEVRMPPTFEELNAMYKPEEPKVTPKIQEPEVPKVSSKPQGSEIPKATSKIQETEISKMTPKEVPKPPDLTKKYEDEEEDVEDEQEIEYDEEDYEGSDYEAEELSDVDDSDLMKRLEEKYGKLPQLSDREDEEEEDKTWTKIPPRSGAQSFEDDLQRANDDLEDNPRSALNAFDKILKNFPQTPEALYGRARALDRLSEMQQSNAILKDAIRAYEAVVRLKMNVSDDLFTAAATRCIDRMRFLGLHSQAMPIHEALILRFDDQPEYRNQLAISYLLLNQLADAKFVLHHTLLRWRDNPIALVHYGFVLKALDQDYEDAALYLSEGLASNAEGTQDGRFYFALGDSLLRLGKRDKARAVFKLGAKKKLFLSEYQRSLYNVDNLKSKPFWTIDETKNRKLFETLELNWKLIRDEGMKLLDQEGFFVDEAENLREKGDWKQFDLFVKGQKIVKHCQKAPLTCNIMESFPAARFCTRGQIKFSVMHPGTHVWPHCGPTNCRIRAHLGLKVPPATFIRVAQETRSWHEGKVLIFDDSFEHEVWHNGTEVRLVLIVDIWHPDLSEAQRRSLHPI